MQPSLALHLHTIQVTREVKCITYLVCKRGIQCLKLTRHWSIVVAKLLQRIIDLQTDTPKNKLEGTFSH